MPLMVISLLMNSIKNGSVSFFIKPVTNATVGRITSLFPAPNLKTYYTFLEGQLKTFPDRNQFLCGKDLTEADVLISFPFKASQARSGMSQRDFSAALGVRGPSTSDRSIQEISGKGCRDRD